MKRFVYFLLTLIFLTVVAFNGYAHEGDDKEKPHKVTSETIKGGHSGDASQLTKAAEQNTMEKDFQTIRREVERSTIFIVIKALALAAAIAGIALVYLRRQKQGGAE